MKSLQTPQVVEPVQAIKPTPSLSQLVKTVYSIERRGYAFYLKIIELYDDNTWKHVGDTYDEPLPHLFDHLDKLLMKGIKL